jgi:hypothetical protein
MYEISIGDFRNFCLDSCCKDKYKFRLNPALKLNSAWLLEGFIETNGKQYFTVYRTNFRTTYNNSVYWNVYMEKTFTSTIEEVRKMIGDMVGK